MSHLTEPPYRRKWSWVTFNYALSRYGSLIVQGLMLYQRLHSLHYAYTPSECPVWIFLRMVGPSIFLAAMQMVLMGRGQYPTRLHFDYH
jgi:hypothetical protein